MSLQTTSANVDPYDIVFSFTDRKGNLHDFTLAELDDKRLFGERYAINYATQFGASVMMLLVLLLVTRAERRRSFIFVINTLTLAVNCIRSMLCATFTTSTFWSPYFQISSDPSSVIGLDRATNITALIMGIVVTALVYISLSMQVWTVCAITPLHQRIVIICFTTIVACLSLGFKIAASVLQIRMTLAFLHVDPDDKLMTISPALQLVAIWLYSFVFTFKLAFAIVRRHRLNMPQFGPMQIVFIMGCQTMVVPAIFHVLQFYGPVAECATIGLTIVCIFLPLSAIWAGVVDNTDAARISPKSVHYLLGNEFFKADQSPCGSNASSSDRSRQMSVCTCLSSKDIEAVPARCKNNKISVERDFGFSYDDEDGVRA